MGVERLTAFSDGVFAIAITLLVLDLHVPELQGHVTNGELIEALLDLGPRIFSYLLSFAVIGLLWTTHHRLFHYIRRADSTLLWLNLLVLMFVSILPFPTSVLGNYGYLPTAVVLYAAIFCLLTVSQYLLWVYATRRHRLVDPDLDPALIAYYKRRGLATLPVWLLSIPLAFVNVNLAYLSWAGIFIMMRLIGRSEPTNIGEPEGMGLAD